MALPKVSSVFDLLWPLLKEYEGFRSHAYYDRTGKVWTIGYGTTVYPNKKKVKKGDLVTRTQAAEYAKNDITTIRIPALTKMVKVPLTNGQTAALLSFMYNLGVGGLRDSSLLTALNEKAQKQTVANLFHLYNKSGGVVLDGLKRRRADEAKVFLS